LILDLIGFSILVHIAILNVSLLRTEFDLDSFNTLPIKTVHIPQLQIKALKK